MPNKSPNRTRKRINENRDKKWYPTANNSEKTNVKIEKYIRRKVQNKN